MQCFPRRAASSMPRPASVSLHWRAFYGRGWITQAALLKTAHWAVFAPSSATGPQLFESTHIENSNFLQTENRQRISTLAVFLWARVDYASRASKKAPQGLFSPAGLFDGSMLFESTRLASGKVITKQKLQYPVRILEFLVERSNLNPNHCLLGHLWRRFHRK